KVVGLFNRLQAIHLDGTVSFPAGLLYVDLEGAALHLRKMVLPIPPGLHVHVRPAPHVTRLPPGQVFREALTLPLPLKVCNPLRHALLAATAAAGAVVADQLCAAATVTFSVGVFPVEPGMSFTPFSPAHPDVFTVSLVGQAIANQVVLSHTVR